MKGHTRRAPLYFIIIFALAACFLAAPANAQTGNSPQFAADGFNIDIVQGIDTIETPSGQVLATENDLAVSEVLSPTVDLQIDNPSFEEPANAIALANSNNLVAPYFLSNGPPGVSLSAYATANLPLLQGSETDFQFLLNNGNSGDPFADFSSLNLPAGLLTTQGNVVDLAPIVSGGTEASFFNAIFLDLTGNTPIPAAVVSTDTTMVGNDQWLDDIVGQNNAGQSVEVNALLNVNYLTYNVTEVTPEASSWLMLLAGLAGVGLFAWSRGRRVV